ncbi:MAG: hypothetical protein DSM106950_25040 [Stigonema ocellatum SAG 48.90 = DSM 106950]|nr:hypothetical protein [Stigonema ocellatum SAG 48.90 = DSM 106950]
MGKIAESSPRLYDGVPVLDLLGCKKFSSSHPQLSNSLQYDRQARRMFQAINSPK